MKKKHTKQKITLKTFLRYKNIFYMYLLYLSVFYTYKYAFIRINMHFQSIYTCVYLIIILKTNFKSTALYTLNIDRRPIVI